MTPRTRSFVVAAVICSLLLSSAQGDKAPAERRTYLRRLMDDGLASGLTKLEHLMAASIVSGTGSDSATAAKATAGGQENAAREAAGKKDATSTSSSTSTSTTTSGTTDDDSVATDDDNDDSSSTSGGGGGKKASNSTSKAKASPPPNLSANVTKTEESAADWYDDDGSQTLAAGDKAEAPSGSTGGASASASASAGSTSGSAAGTNTTLPNGRAHRDENNPHAAEMKRNNPKGDHTSTNDDDDVGYVHHNSTSNEDYVVGDDDDAPKTAADAIVSDLSKKSKQMNMGMREGYVAVFVALMAAAGFGIYVANKHCQRMMKQRRRSGYQSIE